MSNRFRKLVWAALVVLLLAACQSTADETDQPPAEVTSASPDEDTLATFADRYLTALENKDSSAADGLTCEGSSTLHEVVSGADGANWEVGRIRVSDSKGFVELRETVGDIALGFQAEFRDGQWCAMQ